MTETTTTTATATVIPSPRTVDQAIHATFAPRPLKGAYLSKVNQFKRWVHSSPEASTRNGKYLTRDNVDKFFILHLQALVHVQPQNLRQFRNALKTYARNVEFTPPGPAFVIDSPAVLLACEEHKKAYAQHRLSKPECAHANLMSDILSERQVSLSREWVDGERRRRIESAEKSNQEMFMILLEEQRIHRREVNSRLDQILAIHGLPGTNFALPANVPGPAARVSNAANNVDSPAMQKNLRRYAPTLSLPPRQTTNNHHVLPSIPEKMPLCAVDLLEDHYLLELDKYTGVPKPKSVWGKIAMRYSRRMSIFGYIETTADRLRGCSSRADALLAAARMIDAEKGDIPLGRYVGSQRSVQSRKSKQRGVSRPRRIDKAQILVHCYE